MLKKEEFFVKVDLPDKKIEKEIRKELEDYEIDDPFSITEAMQKQSFRYLGWADLLRRAKKVKNTLDRDYELWYVQAIKRVEKKLIEDGNKRPTKDALSNGVMSLFKTNYSIWQDKLEVAQDNINVLDMVLRATVVKQGMLVSIGQMCSRLLDSGNLVVKEHRGKKSL